MSRCDTEILGPNAYRLLGWGLGAEQTTRILAADITAAAITERRLDPHQLGTIIADVMQRNDHDQIWNAVPDRWGTSLATVAQYRPLHAQEVQTTLEACLAQLTTRDLRMTAVLDLLRKLATDADAAIIDAAARAYLMNFPANSRSGKLAKASLAINGTGRARRLAAAAAAQEANNELNLRLVNPHH